MMMMMMMILRNNMAEFTDFFIISYLQVKKKIRGRKKKSKNTKQTHISFRVFGFFWVRKTCWWCGLPRSLWLTQLSAPTPSEPDAPGPGRQWCSKDAGHRETNQKNTHIIRKTDAASGADGCQTAPHRPTSAPHGHGSHGTGSRRVSSQVISTTKLV